LQIYGPALCIYPKKGTNNSRSGDIRTKRKGEIMKFLTCVGLMYKIIVEEKRYGFQTVIAAQNERIHEKKNERKEPPLQLVIDTQDWNGASFKAQDVRPDVLDRLKKGKIIPRLILRTHNDGEIPLRNVLIEKVKFLTSGSQASVATRVWYQVLPFKEEEDEL
jgi:hypothetical protein